jgi:S-adenosylmethionine synthetase
MDEQRPASSSLGTAGFPDKVADQISDAVLDAIIGWIRAAVSPAS